MAEDKLKDIDSDHPLSMFLLASVSLSYLWPKFSSNIESRTTYRAEGGRSSRLHRQTDRQRDKTGQGMDTNCYHQLASPLDGGGGPHEFNTTREGSQVYLEWRESDSSCNLNSVRILNDEVCTL